jgi:hypothetical protein
MLGCNYTADILDAAVPSGGSGLAWDLASRGRVLPPPGRYPVLLRGKTGSTGQDVLQAEALIEGGLIRIPAVFVKNGTTPAWEYLEFLSI